MSAGCSPFEIRAECRARGIGREEEAEILELVGALVSGANDGERRASPDEPPLPPRSPTSAPPEMLEMEEMVDPVRVAEKAISALDPTLGEWKADYAAGTMTALGLFRELGLDALDLVPLATLDACAERIGERPATLLPAYFEPHLIQAGAEGIVRRFARERGR